MCLQVSDVYQCGLPLKQEMDNREWLDSSMQWKIPRTSLEPWYEQNEGRV